MQKAAELLERFEGKTWQCLFPCGGDFPELLRFDGNIEYVRDVIAKTVGQTRDREGYVDASELSDKSDFKRYNHQVNKSESAVPSHAVIEAYIKKFGKDYRYQLTEHPIQELRDRTVDNTSVGRA